MLRLVIEDYTQDRWNRLIGDFTGLSLLQRWEYAEAKARAGPWGVERGVFFKSGEPVGAFQALIRPLPAGLPGGLAWINRGPLHRNDEELAAMMGLLRDRYARKRGMYLRIAPPIENLIAEDLSAEGFAPAGCPGWASAVVDLTAPLEALRGNLRQKWRNCLNKAERMNLEIKWGDGEDIFAAFLEGHGKLIAEKGFATSVTTDLLRALQDLSAPENRMEAFIVSHEGAPAASALIAKFGETCEYLAGNVGDEGRRRNAGQFLLWRVAAAMKAEGFRRFDLGGVDPDLTPKGVFRFKDGLAGTPYRLAREVEALDGGPLGRLVRWRVNRARANG